MSTGIFREITSTVAASNQLSVAPEERSCVNILLAADGLKTSPG